MHRYGISSYEEFYSTWSRAQYLVALDAMFWNNPKEKEHYGQAPNVIDPRTARAADVFARMGFDV